MYRIIGGDGREYGPVTGDTIRQWVVQNRANAKTLVRADDSADWRPLGEIPEFAGSFGAPPPQAADVPSPAAQAAPAAPAAAVDPKAITAELAACDYHLGIGDSISAAFRVLGMNYWQAVGVSLLVMICIFVSSALPIIGFLVSLLLTQAFNGGLYFYFVKLARGDDTNVGDGFSGFSIGFGQLVLLSIVMNLLISVVLLPVIVPVLGITLWEWSPYVMVPLICVLVLPAIYLSIAWMFAAILVIDRGFEFWDAMELSRKVVSKHWFRVFFLMILAALIGLAGMIALFVGIFFTMPVMFATVAVAYETMFPRQ